MKRIVLAVTAVLALAVPAAFAAQHSGHGGHTSGMTHSGAAAHEEVTDGVKASFTVKTIKEAMLAMGMELPKGVKESHHIALKLVDTKTGKEITSGEARLKVIAPDKSEQVKDMPAMHGHFGADVVMTAKGKYGVMSKFKTPDGKVRSVQFWYQLK